MATFKEINASDIKTGQSFLYQLIDIAQKNISGSDTRKKYSQFITGGLGPGITSSLFHTVYDNNFSIQSANPVFDITVGLFRECDTVTGSVMAQDYFGNLVFPSQSVMMREKIDVYRQYAQLLLGNAEASFRAPITGTSKVDRINEAMFISFRRLFTRDKIRPQTFAMRFFTTAAITERDSGYNLIKTSESGSDIFTDVGSLATQQTMFGGTAGSIKSSLSTHNEVGSLWYQKGVAVLDLKKIMSGTQHVSGVIKAINENSPAVGAPTGTMVIGARAADSAAASGSGAPSAMTSGNPKASFIPDLMVSASIDDILDHMCSCRFSSGTYTAITFSNTTNVNSTLIYCRTKSEEFNYSSNPTFTDESNTINVLEAGIEDRQQSFTYFTTIGLYDAHDNLLAVAKTSRPVEKSTERDLTIRVRLDF